LVEFNTRQLVLKAHLALAYLAFPLLEAVLKKVCHHYVDYSGNVVTAFDILLSRGGVREYVPNDLRKGKCSSLRDPMFLLHQIVSDSDLRPRIEEMRQHLSALDSSMDPFDLMYSWRNDSLHGHTNFPTIGGTLLNFVVLIAYNQIRAEYNHLRDEIWNNVQRDIEMFRFTGYRSPWSYYPPF